MNGFRLTPAIKKLLIANVAVFAIQQIFHGTNLWLYFALYREALFGHFFIWTPITYMFLHGGFGHIFFNMFALWMFGTELESNYGTNRFYLLYFLGGIVGGLFHIIISGDIPTIGASAGVMAIVIAYGFTYPNRIIYLNFFLPVKAKWLAVGYVVLDLIGAFSSSSGVAHLAHLGGAFIGYLFTVKPYAFDRLLNIFTNMPKIIRIKKAGAGAKVKTSKSNMKANAGSTDKEKAAFYQKKVDEILDKINEVGYLNLTDDDRDLLDRGSRFLREHHHKNGN